MKGKLCLMKVNKMKLKFYYLFIYTLGTIGSTFYIILKGSVAVCKLEEDKSFIPFPLKFSKRSDSTITMSHLPMKSNESSIDNTLVKKTISSYDRLPDQEKKSFILTEVKILGGGSAFGELALIENKPRAATIRCKENCHFAVLDKTYFVHILSKVLF